MENIKNIIKERHSVRNYTDKKIEENIIEKINNLIDECNKDGNLSAKLFLEEPMAFSSRLAHYGNFRNAKNYIVMSGKKSKDLDERCGYYGEKIVLKAEELGLNTCWVGFTYGKGKIPYKIPKDEKISAVISIGYGVDKGVNHKIKDFNDVSITKGDIPEWYKKGIEYALLAPTSMNQQKFKFELIENNKVKLTSGIGFFAKVDLGIVKYHFELGANINNFKWLN